MGAEFLAATAKMSSVSESTDGPKSASTEPAKADVEAASANNAPTDAAKVGSEPAEVPPSESDRDSAISESPEAAAASESSDRDRGLILWVVGILLVLSVELFIYGRNGDIQVCVGIEGGTDFSLVGQNRTPENYRKFPQCSKRLNLGMWTSSEKQAQSALEDACGRATVTRGPQERQACLRRDKGWKRRVTKDHIPPWDSRLYRRLLWLD